MTRVFVRYLPAAILVGGSILLWSAHAQDAVPIAGALTSVLDDVPGLEVVNQTLSVNEQRVAGMTDYVARAYRRDNTTAFTTFVSYYDRQTQGKTIHSPRNCLPGAGWEIVGGGPHSITANGGTYSVNRYLLKNGKATAVAYYWYQGRGRVTANEYRVKWNLLRDAALHGRTEEALVRLVIPVRMGAVSTDGGGAAVAAADDQARVLVAKLIVDLDRVLPPIG